MIFMVRSLALMMRSAPQGMAAEGLYGCRAVSAGGERKRPVDQAVSIRRCHPDGEDTEGHIGKHVQAFGLRTWFTA
jgi:hypothetical protein